MTEPLDAAQAIMALHRDVTRPNKHKRQTGPCPFIAHQKRKKTRKERSDVSKNSKLKTWDHKVVSETGQGYSLVMKFSPWSLGRKSWRVSWDPPALHTGKGGLKGGEWSPALLGFTHHGSMLSSRRAGEEEGGKRRKAFFPDTFNRYLNYFLK